MQDLIGLSPDSIVVAGGSATRLGGIDKAMLPLGESGAALLADVVNACPSRVFVVGLPRDLTHEQITWIPDLNPRSGPAGAFLGHRCRKRWPPRLHHAWLAMN